MWQGKCTTSRVRESRNPEALVGRVIDSLWSCTIIIAEALALAVRTEASKATPEGASQDALHDIVNCGKQNFG